ncbi:hypothetical protein KJ782_07000 [Patescibacteria group bacterium]|nr:hypothetical protein [Patescibacteria group bacterium]
MPVYDFRCACGVELLDHVACYDEKVLCPLCKEVMDRDMPAPHTFSTIVPTYPGSAKLKAGYVHKHQARSAEKTQMGYGGGVSTAHPTGSKKNT